MEKSEEDIYQDEKKKAQELYATFRDTRCPALNNQPVHFTSEGFNHLIFKSNRSERNRKDQMGRFRILDLAKEIIRLTTTVQERDEVLKEVEVKKHGRKIKEMKTVKYWAFVAILKNKRMKVIVKRIGEGQLFFYSVIPFWDITSVGNVHFRNLNDGDLAEE